MDFASRLSATAIKNDRCDRNLAPLFAGRLFKRRRLFRAKPICYRQILHGFRSIIPRPDRRQGVHSDPRGWMTKQQVVCTRIDHGPRNGALPIGKSSNMPVTRSVNSRPLPALGTGIWRAFRRMEAFDGKRVAMGRLAGKARSFHTLFAVIETQGFEASSQCGRVRPAKQADPALTRWTAPLVQQGRSARTNRDTKAVVKGDLHSARAHQARADNRARNDAQISRMNCRAGVFAQWIGDVGGESTIPAFSGQSRRPHHR